MMSLRVLLTAAAAFAAFLTMAESSFAQIVPFRSVGENNLYNPATAGFGGDGITTHMGATSGLGLAIPAPTDDPLVLDWTGGGEFASPNGDKTFFSGGGKVYLEPLGGTMFTATWVAEFDIIGGTGRFANAGPGTAPLDVIAINHPFDMATDPLWAYDYLITGDIDLGKRK